MERDEELTILWNFTGTRYTWLDGLHGGFEIYRTSIQNSAPYGITAKHFTGEYGPFECVWRLMEPAGTRIKIQVMEFEGSDVTLSAGNGHDPSRGDPLLVISSLYKSVSLGQEVLSFSSRMWVALKYTKNSGRLHRAEIVLTTYDISGKRQSVMTATAFPVLLTQQW